MSTIKFTIPDPCHENWNNMTPADQGRFCLSCKKNVMDFTEMSDREVHNIISKGDANMCGRFSDTQMQTGINYTTDKKAFWHRYFFGMLLPAFFLSKPANAQVGKIARNTETHPAKGMEKMLLPCFEKSFELAGRVQDALTKELPGLATVAIKETGNRVVVDDSGYFNLKGKVSGSAITLQITSIGYESREIEIAVPANNFFIGEEIFYLKKQVIEMDPVVLRAASNYLRGTVGLFSTVVTRHRVAELPKRIMTAITDSVKIFPNPVNHGDAFNLALKLKQTGTHTIQVIDVTGRVIYQQSITVTDKRYLGQVNSNTAWSAGIYILRVIGKDGGLKSVAQFVVK